MGSEKEQENRNVKKAIPVEWIEYTFNIPSIITGIRKLRNQRVILSF